MFLHSKIYKLIKTTEVDISRRLITKLVLTHKLPWVLTALHKSIIRTVTRFHPRHFLPNSVPVLLHDA